MDASAVIADGGFQFSAFLISGALIFICGFGPIGALLTARCERGGEPKKEEPPIHHGDSLL
jgi:hypothetical protein